MLVACRRSSPAAAGSAILSCLAALAGTGAATAARAATVQDQRFQAAERTTSIRDLFGKRASDDRSSMAPDIGRYVAADGGHFILDRSAPRPLLRFENSPEVWVLQAQPAPRGDVIYRNDVGDPVLRATRWGGVTVFTASQPGGSPASLSGPATPLRPPPVSPEALLRKLVQASAKASQLAQKLIPFDAPEVTPASAPLVADAAVVTVEAVNKVSKRRDGRGQLQKWKRVVFNEGRKPDAAMKSGVMQITIAPAHGVAGRPSSVKIMAAALGR